MQGILGDSNEDVDSGQVFLDVCGKLTWTVDSGDNKLINNQAFLVGGWASHLTNMLVKLDHETSIFRMKIKEMLKNTT